MRVVNHVLAEIISVVILNNAADLDVRKGKGFGHVPHSLCLDNSLLKSLSLEIGNRSVGSDRPPSYPCNVVSLSLIKWNFDISVLTSFFGQNLDTNIIIFMSS